MSSVIKETFKKFSLEKNQRKFLFYSLDFVSIQFKKAYGQNPRDLAIK